MCEQRFEDSEYFDHCVASIIGEQLEMNDDFYAKYSRSDIDKYLEWFMSKGMEKYDALAREFVMRTIGTKIEELKGV